MTQVLTANRLGDGQVVFLTADGNWSTAIGDSLVAADDAFAEELLALGQRAERECEVIGPYLIEVRQEAGTIEAVAIREAIRANGPTVAYGPA
ncbi:MAG: DUF2849 domain-containing protein [Gammaproteobacteria bacterium]|nr:DUF2849 domain-containing protein [Gammaproteobacteria bacterium]